VGQAQHINLSSLASCALTSLPPWRNVFLSVQNPSVVQQNSSGRNDASNF